MAVIANNSTEIVSLRRLDIPSPPAIVSPLREPRSLSFEPEDDSTQFDRAKMLRSSYAKFSSLRSTLSRQVTDDPSIRRESIQPSRMQDLVSHMHLVTGVPTFITKTTIDPLGTVALYWKAMVCMVAAYNLIFIPIRSAFPYFEERYRYTWYFLDYLADLYYLVDILVLMRTSYLEEGCLEYNWKLLILHYVTSTPFLMDVIAILPLDFLLVESYSKRYRNYIIGVRLTRLLKIFKIYTFISRTESRSDRPNYILLGSLVLVLATLIHFNSCVYFVVSTVYAFNFDGNDSWVYQGVKGVINIQNISLKYIVPEKYFLDQYFHCLHWSTQMLTTIAEVDSPVHSFQFVYAILLLLFAVLMFATLVGNVGTIIINLNAARTRFESRLDNVKQYMHNRNINETLQENVLRWFDHLWEKNRGIDEQETLHNLPNKLRAQIAFSANEKVLSNNPIYTLGDVGFQIGLVLKLRSELFPPKETIYRRGNIGNDMYIIRSGRVLLSRRKNKEANKELGDGEFFGINCVINFDEFGRERSETATTVGFCDILMLEKKDLMELLVDYPDVKEKLSEQFYEDVGRFPSVRRKKDLDIAKVTRDVNILVQKYDELKEKNNILLSEHRKLLNAVRIQIK